MSFNPNINKTKIYVMIYLVGIIWKWNILNFFLKVYMIDIFYLLYGIYIRFWYGNKKKLAIIFFFIVFQLSETCLGNSPPVKLENGWSGDLGLARLQQQVDISFVICHNSKPKLNKARVSNFRYISLMFFVSICLVQKIYWCFELFLKSS